jgi:probable rRNA maturation factor
MDSDPSSPDRSATVEVIVEAAAWTESGVDWETLAADLAARALAGLHGARDTLAVSVLLADDVRLRDLNRAFRGKDRPTNVLSFPAPPPLSGQEAGMLGDVALAFETCAREAREQDKSFRDHAAHLILHGVLHLHGLDHEHDEADAERMEALERAILAEIGIADPYRERGAVHV